MATLQNRRTSHRWKLLALMLTAVFFAFGSFWLLQAMQGDDAGALGDAGNEPDYIVENFSFVRMTPTGQPRYVVSGERLAHHPVTDVSEVSKPVVESMAPGRPRMTMNAERAQIHHKENRVELADNVDIVRPATPTSQAMRARTDALTVLTDEEIVKTDRPVQMTLGASSVNGIGLVAENPTQKLHMGRGQIIYPPRPR
ncbi:LPS export ABC transporter periplasmic protein LptC [Massilia sp. YIM B02769]|jgi:lipopolysaccharide export system protein LptC|uniref:LPS export ABC transporter periplasmic protein LptC n=1 Tax=unclassified Massilia TaxID=2609279 RepID=UPI0025B64623|nr:MULTISPECIES: LPS export ABC transporter periplasmic protein LptC [unclassified Massilia]MDN4059663.1 LPS export ABC transporter periplasmic protein LptC [Massilia sp. YIM B02769]